MIHKFLITFALTAILSTSSGAQSLTHLSDVLIGGYYRHTAVYQNTAYVVSDYGLHIIDISNPGQSEYMGEIKTEGGAFNIKIDSCYAYILTQPPAKMIVFDLSNEINPVQISEVNFEEGVISLDIYGDYAAVLASGIIYMINIVNPASPEIAGETGAQWWDYELEFSDSNLFTGADLGSNVYDIQNITEPFIVNRIHSEYVVQDFDYDNDMLYFARNLQGLCVVDVSNPFSPEFTAPFNLGYTERVEVGEDYHIYTSTFNQFYKSYFNGSFVYTVDEDIADGYIENIDCWNEHCFLDLGYDGLNITDEGDILSHIKNNGYIYRVDEEESILFVYCVNDGIYILDVSTPADPIILNQLEIAGYISFLEAENNFLFIQSASMDSLLIYNVSNPAAPYLQNSIGGFDGLNDLIAKDNLIYTIDYGTCLFKIYDISDVMNPTVLSEFPINYPWKLAVEDDNAYISLMEDTMLIVDISDLGNPSIESSIEYNHDQDFQVEGGFLYSPWLDIWDVRDASNPMLIHEGINNSGRCVSAENNLLAIGSSYTFDSGFYLYDVSDPSEPVELERVYLGSNTNDILLKNNLVICGSASNVGIYENGYAGIDDKAQANTPADEVLLEVYPNPFNSSTTITFGLPNEGDVSLKVYDILGKEISKFDIRNSNLGKNSVVWDAKNCASGIYFIRLGTVDYNRVVKILLVK